MDLPEAVAVRIDAEQQGARDPGDERDEKQRRSDCANRGRRREDEGYGYRQLRDWGRDSADPRGSPTDAKLAEGLDRPFPVEKLADAGRREHDRQQQAKS